jgi:hypothetical protein
MNMRDFIRQNRAEIDVAIDRAVGFVPRTASCDCPKSGTDHHHQPEQRNDNERRQWILNDEGFYNWARREGVPI